MQIVGLQKMTLLDYPGKVACTVFLPGCNFRCPFCHNGQLLEGKQDILMDDGELLIFLSKRKGLLDGVCITGGEPTLQPELVSLIAQIKSMGFAVKLDTNGSHPDVMKDLVSQNLLDYAAMDIKNSPDAYTRTAGACVQLQQIEESIRFLAEDRVDYEFRTTVVDQLHDPATILQMGRWVSSLAPEGKVKRWFLQPFVDRDTVLFAGLCAPEASRISEFAEFLRPFAKEIAVRG